ncbi:stage V sporulation protein R [Anaerosolibacter carboniphilus]|uniref:Stage V sporulation protein R n=1 Tax=Anaerosolibacter carboniphilus TaxID=1417629 RepID=A0A841KTH0_9FIRM|nr:SpoVR family protein [Anaerosolibacter carboniphilus]MBB6216711.1 stage V sporulation protein R [Anaerosolibacter carboniphilus]
MEKDRMDYFMKWKERIASAVLSLGLEPYPQEINVLNEEDFAIHRLHYGFPLQLPRWRFSKKQQPFNLLDHRGLFYRIALYVHPDIAYFSEKSTLEEKIFAMIHLHIYSDFVKHNRLLRELYKDQDALGNFDMNQRYIVETINQAELENKGVKKILESAHVVRFQENHLLDFMMEHGSMAEWQRRLVDIIAAETAYFVPHLETMVMYEGWAGFWYEKILDLLDLPNEIREACLKLQGLVFYDGAGYISIERLGTLIFKSIQKAYGKAKVFDVRREETDRSFIEKYLDQAVYEELSSICGFEKGVLEKHKKNLLDLMGTKRIPVIQIKEVRPQDGALLVEHVFDGRELQQEYVFELLKAMVTLWGNKIILKTNFNAINKLVLCDEYQTIAIKTEGK